ncbi:MAG TPA: putative addiction module antidote protein [Nitrospirales bacterium]|nr:putative addiction module antidote protein [Nitrospiraceae bacterium]HNP29508.1 putative addiction module antidote protein [Nitrospirales bacterium]
MTKKVSQPLEFGNLEVLKDPEQAALYLEEILADGDIDLFKEALKDVAAARVGNMTTLAKKTHLAREALYTSLSRKGNPRLDTLTKVLDAAGLRLTVTTA